MMTPLLFLTALLAGHGAATPLPGRVRLPETAQVTGQVVLLAHFLPEDAPTPARRAAERVVLGPAPEQNSARAFSRPEVAAACRAAAIPCEALFEIPERMTAKRGPAWLDAATVLSLVGAALRLDQPLTPAEVSFPALRFSERAPALHVISVKQDPLLHRATVRIAPLRGNSPVPFDVLVHRAMPFGGPLGGNVSPESAEESVASQALVDPRRLAVLTLTSRQAHLVLQVHPLEKGAQGQVIRVRLPASGKTLRAAVIGQDTLEANW